MQADVTPSPRPEVRHLADFAAEAAAFICALIAPAIADRGLFRLALAGGNTPRPVYAALAARADLPWSKIQITFGDERCVPPEDDASNYRMAHESLLAHLPIPSGNVFRMRGEIPPADAAAEYEQKLGAIAARFGEARYRHDLILLGMGEDGHTASLFPGSPALDEQTRNVIPATGPKPPPQRITLTFPLLNAARQIAFLVIPSHKTQVLDPVLAGDQQYPSARVRPTDGQVTWLLGPSAGK